MTDRERARERAWDALGGVRDPELDEPITELGFVGELSVDDGGVALVRLRLPTYFCAPNFAYMMVADALDAVAPIPGVTRTEVRLDDHFASAEINAGVTAGQGFAGAFPGTAGTASTADTAGTVDTADAELAELRRTFRRKAHLAAEERVCRSPGVRGRTVAELTRLRLGDLPPSPELERLRRRRADLGLPAGPDAWLLVDEQGEPVRADDVATYLRLARATRVSIDGNAGFCRGLLRTRYGEDHAPGRDPPPGREATGAADEQRAGPARRQRPATG